MRQPKPFFRKQTQSYYVQIGPEQIPLGKDEKAAWDEYHKIMADRGRDLPKQRRFELTVAQAVTSFLDWCKDRKAEGTHDYYSHRLEGFPGSVGNLKLRDLRPHHVDDWIGSHKQWNDTTRHGVIRSIQRACNWAVKQGLIEKNPVGAMEKPTPAIRENIVTEDQYEAIIESTRDREFRDLITVAWLTGCRPQEICKVEARHVRGDRWIFERKNSKGKKYNRVVYLPPKAAEITRRLVNEHPTGRLFRNRKGRPWTKCAIKCRFQRLRKKLGIAHHVSLYTLRHSYATHAIKRGVDLVTLARLMGHRDPTMIMRVYGHLDQQEHLAEAARKAIGA